MSMNLSELLRKGTVRKAAPDASLARNLLKFAERDIKAASDNIASGNADWALAIAYNSMLSAGRALIAAKGYSPSSEAHHVAVVEFCAAVLPPQEAELVSSFNRYRVRRHDVVYGVAESTGKVEAENAISKAREFLELIKSKL